jgi:hypothetical protein
LTAKIGVHIPKSNLKKVNFQSKVFICGFNPTCGVFYKNAEKSGKNAAISVGLIM